MDTADYLSEANKYYEQNNEESNPSISLFLGRIFEKLSDTTNTDKYYLQCPDFDTLSPNPHP
ncbi:MAG: hypothetical protein LBT04_00495 [Prevotellaceae bacterium]|jgi:hypothetical protein|nr:hypothetical protein [Prevotellaceae bacterium]